MIPPELGDTGKMSFFDLNRIKVEGKSRSVVFIILKSEIRIFHKSPASANKSYIRQNKALDFLFHSI